MKQNKNIFTQLIDLLGVKYTKSYSARFYREHPYKNTLYGISKMLWTYGVSNIGLRLNDKMEIQSIAPPFVAQLNQEFVIVDQLSANSVHYLLRDEKVTITFDDFFNEWNGVVLLAETDETSIEPTYRENRKKEFFGFVEQFSLLFVIILVSILPYILNDTFTHIGYNISLFLNLMGAYVGYLLILKQLDIQSDSADHLCALLRKGDCNSVLKSQASKFLGVIGWSEVGFGYFLSNILLLVFTPSLLPYLAIINVCTLPYTFWSVWYQVFKVKELCVLCLLTQTLLWAVFICNIVSGFIETPRFILTDVLATICIYLLPFLTIRLLLPILATSKEAGQLKQDLNSLKMRKDVFWSLLKEQPYCETNRALSSVILGNPEAHLTITVFTNPHCDPCALMHERIRKILVNSPDSLCVQYIFTSFYQDVESSAKKLIATYQEGGQELGEKALDEWFQGEKYHPQKFFKKYQYPIDTPEVEHEYKRHCEWKKQYALKHTPILFLNGFVFPIDYKIEDIVYFLDLTIDPKNDL